MSKKSKLKRSVIILIHILIISSAYIFYVQHTREPYIIKDQKIMNGLVPDKQTATNIAEEVLFGIYQEKSIQYLPLEAQLTWENIWFVKSTKVQGKVLYVEIHKADAEILRVYEAK